MAAIQCESSSLNGMTDEEIVKSLRDGAFSNVSTLPGLGAYRRALRILSTSASPLAHAFIKEYTNETWDVQKALSAFRMGDLIQNVETGETQRWERQGVVNGSLILNAVPYKLDQLRLLDHEAMECRGRGPPSFMSPENGKNRGGYAEATPREGDVVVHKESGAVSIVYNHFGDGTCFAQFASTPGTNDRWPAGTLRLLGDDAYEQACKEAARAAAPH